MSIQSIGNSWFIVRREKMNKRSLMFIVSLFLIGAFAVSACAQAAEPAIVIGVNAPLTGDIPKVGEGSKFAAEMWLEDINAAGGLEVGGKK
jgi:branched-chain amino acid transport system substrate-binding protein